MSGKQTLNEIKTQLSIKTRPLIWCRQLVYQTSLFSQALGRDISDTQDSSKTNGRN